ncbi:MAG: LCP family protein [Lachnospiraceae bacterium]|nr:LCP family protein [Lachnospiraceae bacterium]MBQ8878115.1 LCP family protein [Lachnospiraceae bacterium]
MATESKKPVKKTGPKNTDEMRAKKAAAKKRVEAKEKSKKKRGKILLFIVEIFVLLLMVVVLYGVLKTEKVGKVDIPEEDIVINEEVKVKAETTMKGYRNVALFGVDSTSGELTKNTRSDSIMIASINMDTGECKLVSVYRDTYLNLGNDTYNKCNSAYAKGGPEQAINMLNMNLDMNITDFITVGFSGLSNTIDALGGVMIDVDEAEIEHLNNYQLCMAEDLKRSYTPVTSTGYQLLDGLQATAYCRIRYTAGDDFKRAERQREVLMAIADKAKTASPATLNEIANDVFGQIYTSLDLSEILELLGDVTKYEIVDQAGFPEDNMRDTGTIGSKGSCVVPVNLSENVTWLHSFFFDDEAYTASEAVQEYSEKIKSDTSGYLN